jgi:hypothetical protein
MFLYSVFRFCFFGARLKTAKSDCWLRHVHLFVRVEQHCSNWTGFLEVLYLSIFRKFVLNNKVLLKFYKNKRYPTRRPIFIYDISPSYSWNEKCFSQKLQTESKLTFCVPVYDVMRKHMVEPGKPQLKIQYGSHSSSAGCLRLHTYTQSM